MKVDSVNNNVYQKQSFATPAFRGKGLDPKIAINEALEITKDYSDEGNHKQVSFNNRVLNDISKEIKK